MFTSNSDHFKSIVISLFNLVMKFTKPLPIILVSSIPIDKDNGQANHNWNLDHNLSLLWISQCWCSKAYQKCSCWHLFMQELWFCHFKHSLFRKACWKYSYTCSTNIFMWHVQHWFQWQKVLIYSQRPWSCKCI